MPNNIPSRKKIRVSPIFPKLKKQDYSAEFVWEKKIKDINVVLCKKGINKDKKKKLYKRMVALEKHLKKLYFENNAKSIVEDPYARELSGIRNILMRESEYKIFCSKKVRGMGVVCGSYIVSCENPEDHEIKDCTDNIIYQIRNYRAHRKFIQTKNNILSSNTKITYKTYKGTHPKSGAILELQTKKRVYSIFNKKKPKTKNKYVGVEIEFCCKHDNYAIAKKLLDAKVLQYCEWHRDDSLRPKSGENGHEICVLATEKKIIPVLKKICKALSEMGAETVGRKCGLHVHLDARNRNRDVLYNNLVACQKWFMLMSNPNRRNGEFCRRVNSKSFPKVFKGGRHERYKTINAASYFKHQTIEVRTHDSTVEVNDLVNWVKLLIKVANYSNIVRRSFTSIKKMKETLNLEDNLESYIRDKVNYWKVLGDSVPYHDREPRTTLTWAAPTAQPSQELSDRLDAIINTNR